ncbi:MAG TPA: hypothetical protein VFA19_09900 [Gaiellaceae bacterium]|nr:hypothetical protein [Gaiellaceae bacterium]
MSGAEELWIPLVDEPLGSIVREIQESHPEIDELVAGPRRTLAFRTFAYIRVGMLLGQLLVDHDVPSGEGAWVDALLRDPENREAVVREVRAVAEEVAAQAQDDEPAVPDEGARQRFREFARKQLG